ncbi:MAG: FtsW/RodA/SpoVE family cell cycle protein, partial [Chloroflexi bacterium]|nr:FtsW/RodA/SpoVE family cell cycle protein [Chloroflexota bacterium]
MHLAVGTAGTRRNTLVLLYAPALMLVLAPLLVLMARGRVQGASLPLIAFVIGALPLITPLVLRLAERDWDPLLLAPAWVLCAFGLAVIARVQPDVLGTQMLWIGVGWAAFIALAGFPLLLLWLRRYRAWLLVAGLILALLALLFGDDVTGQGTRLWLRVGPITIQPAELLRVLLIGFLAGHLAEWPGQASETRTGPLRGWLLRWLPLFAMVGASLLVVVAQRDFGPALTYGASFIAMLYLATGRRDYVVRAVALAALLAALAYLGSDRIQIRVETWLNPWSDPRGSGYQSLQALGGFVFGGVFGSGPGFGSPGLIPAAHTDYPLAVIGEEWGLTVTLGIVALYGLIVTRALARTRQAGDRFGQLLSGGLGISFAVQVLIVFGGVLRLTPLTGLTSPFLSYGGSSMVMAWVMLALLTSVGAPSSAPHPAPRPALTRHTRELGMVTLAGFLAVALALGYWQVARADLAGNPMVGGERFRLASERVMRGRILDRTGAVFAQTELGPDGTPRRVYEDPGAVHVVGFDSAQVGATGVEALAADTLMGRDARSPSDTVRDLLHQHREGHDVHLTLDLALQRVAEQAMGDSLGAVVALDPQRGDILAMVSNPVFSPDFNDEEWKALRADPQSALLNRATLGLYTPGSTFKTVTLAAALEAGVVTADTPAVCLPEVVIGGVRIVSSNEPPGRQTTSVADAYAYSCNTFFAELGVELGARRLRAMAVALGLTEAPPFDLATGAGTLSNTDQFFESDAGLAVSAFGQGQLQFTPLSLALATAAIANGGVVPRPRLFLDHAPAPWRRAMSEATAREMSELMAYGVEAGWASTVALPGVRVAGKTGSAEVGDSESSHALFIAFAPVDD